MAEKDRKNEEQEADGEVQEGKTVVTESEELKDRLLRMAAEFDNYKKRVAKDIDGSKEMGRAEVITKLLPVVDEFEFALNALSEEDMNQKGIAMIYSNFIGILKGFGLREIETEGKADPYKHEVVLTRESDKEDSTIIEVVRKGYMINNVMLRPSSVIIAKKEKANNEDGDKNDG